MFKDLTVSQNLWRLRSKAKTLFYLTLPIVYIFRSYNYIVEFWQESHLKLFCLLWGPRKTFRIKSIANRHLQKLCRIWKLPWRTTAPMAQLSQCFKKKKKTHLKVLHCWATVGSISTDGRFSYRKKCYRKHVDSPGTEPQNRVQTEP